MFHLSLPVQLQRDLRQLFKEFFTSSESDYHESLGRLQLTLVSQCLSKENYLDYFYDIQTSEYLLLSLLSIARHRPDHIHCYLNIAAPPSSKDAVFKSASMEQFLPALVELT